MGVTGSCCIDRDEERSKSRQSHPAYPQEQPSLRKPSVRWQSSGHFESNTTAQKRIDHTFSTPWYLFAFAVLLLALTRANPSGDFAGLSASAMASTSFVALLLLVLTIAGRIWSKISLFMFGVAIMLFGRDKRWKKTPDPAASGMCFQRDTTSTKRVIFIRHGESTWNQVFNKGILRLPFNLVWAVLDELLCILDPDSVFLDAPLNKKGVQDARELARHLDRQNGQVTDDVAALRGDSNAPESVLVTSNLRRAMETILIGLWKRIHGSREKVQILSCLQEVTTNVDGVVLADAGTVDPLPMLEQYLQLPMKGFNSTKYFDASENAGQKPLRAKGIDRLNAFCDWVFMTSTPPCVIAAGHSFWFRYFFKTYLSHQSRHPSKTKKMQNGGVVAFNLERALEPGGRVVFRIDEASITVIHGGFEGK